MLSLKSKSLRAGVLCLPLLICAPVVAQNESAPPPANLVVPRAEAREMRFFWCAGVTDTKDLEAYVAAGFDTLVIPLPWRAAEDGALFDSNFAPQRALAVEGSKRGLKILFSLPASPEGLAMTRISADSPSYSALWTNWTQSAMNVLADTPGLAGWMLPDDSRALVTFDDGGFRRYLTTHFASIEALNARWTTGYADFDSVSLSDVEALGSAWKERVQSNVGDGLRPLAAASDPNAAFSPAALSLAHYKAGAWQDLMVLWAGTVRGADAKRLVFSGNCPDYAQLISMPEGVDVSVAGVAPSVAEPDIVTHNVQGVDIARRGGTHGVVSRLSIEPRADLNAAAIAQLLPRWVDAAIAHGARGVAFDSFAALTRNPAMGDAVAKTLARAKSEPLESEAPVATMAVLLEPLAEGATLQVGPNLESRGLYGFGEGLVRGEPSTLITSLRWGTAFGGVDYLSPGDLSSVDLSRYATILAPQLLDCSPDTAQKLGDWMRSGGTLVADLGLGALQNGGSATALPPQMALLAGGTGPFELQTTTFNLRGAAPHPLLPTWATKLDARPGMVLSRGDGSDDTAFEGPVGFAPPSTGAVTVATGPTAKSAVVGGTATRVALTLAPVERGFFVFAPFRLWASWRPGQTGFDPLHGDIMARGATLAVSSDALTPFPAGTALGSTRFPEIVNRATSLTLLDHSAGGDLKNVVIDTTGSGDWLWSNALVRLLPPSATVFNGSRPAPIQNPDEFEARPRALALYSMTGAGQKVVCRVRPIAVQNLNGGTITAQIVSETAKGLSLSVWGNTQQIAPMNTGAGWQPVLSGGITNFRVSVVNSPGGYSCPPGSRHRVSVADFALPDDGAKPKGGRKDKNRSAAAPQIAIADARGRLQIEFSGAACSLKIEPDAGLVSIERRPR